MDEINILITGMGYPLGHNIYKAAKLSNIPLNIFLGDSSKFSVGFTFGEKNIILPLVKNKDYIENMISILNDNKIQGVFIGTTVELEPLSKNKSYIEENTDCIIFSNFENTIKISNDKYLTSKFLKENDLGYPYSLIIQKESEIKYVKEEIGYPCIIKPRFGSASKNVFFIKTEQELTKHLPDDSYVVQEYLKGKEYTTGIYTDRNSKIIDSMTMFRVLDFGLSYKVVVDEFPKINLYCMEIAKKIKSRGSINIQTRMTKNGPTCFEINPRISSTAPMRANFGMNEIEFAIRDQILNENIIPIKHKKGVGFRYWKENYVFEDVMNKYFESE